MKKTFSIILIVAILLSVYTYSSGEETAKVINTLDLNGNQLYENASSLCFVNNALYVLGAHAVYHWTVGMDSPEVFLDLSEATTYQYSEQPPEDEAGALAWANAIRYLFTDGETLYGLHPYSGQVFEVTCEALRPIAQLPKELLMGGGRDAPFFREIKSAVCMQDRLFLLLGTDDYEDYAKTQLFSFGLTDQAITVYALAGAQCIAAGVDKKLIAFVQGEESGIWQYDIASDRLEQKMIALRSEETPSGMAWDANSDALVYYTSNRVVLTDLSGVTQTKAYLPVSYASSTTPAACSPSGIYAYPYANRVFLRDISIEGEASQTVLNLMGTVSSNLVIEFSIENPDIAIVSVETNTADYLKQAVVSADSSIDLIVASAPGDFTAMKKKGFAASLNANDDLVTIAKQLYPTIQNAIFDGEKLVGYPTTLNPSSWTVNESKWKEFDLGDYPKTYEELFQSISIWLDDYAEDNMDYTLSDIQQSSVDALVSMIVKEYIFQNETADERLSFNTPAFLSLMKNVIENVPLLSEENEQWGMPLLSAYYQGFGTSYNDSDRVCMLLSPTLDQEKLQSLNANMEVLFVNAASLQQEAAGRFISFCAQNMDTTTQYTLNPNLNEPVRNPLYEARLETLNAELQILKDRLVVADDSQVISLRDEIAQKETLIENFDINEWAISPESIAVYREAAQNMRVPYDSAFLADGENGGFNAISAVVTRYCSDGLNMDELNAFISELDQVTYLVYMENN